MLISRIIKIKCRDVCCQPHGIRAKKIALLWAPVLDKYLSYLHFFYFHLFIENLCTQVGIIDITKANNMFSTFIPFTSKGIYSISWATVTINNEKIICLFACGDTKIAYYPESGVNKLSSYFIYI